MANKPLEIQMRTLLDSYDAEVQKVVDDTAKQVVKEGVSKLKSTSPHESGDYSRGWTSRKDALGYVIYNAKKPGLTHVLENGHVTRNQFGTWRRTPAHPHIKAVETWVNDEFTNQVEKKIGGIS